MSKPSLLKFLRNFNATDLLNEVKNQKKYEAMLSKLQLDKKTSRDEFVALILTEARKEIDAENRKKALVFLKAVKPLLSLVKEDLHVSFYLALANSFIMKNEFEGANKSALKAKKIADKLGDPGLKIKVLNLQFAIHRTTGKEDAIKFLLESKDIAMKHKMYENIVYTEVNIGLMHLFNREITKAADSCRDVVDLIEKHPYPNKRMIMPADFYLHLFSENKGLVTIPEYKETVKNGIKIVLRAVNSIKNFDERTRRLTILGAIIKMSDDILSYGLKQIEMFVENQEEKPRTLMLTAVANGLSDHKNYRYALMLYQNALKTIDSLSDDVQFTMKKNYAYLLSQSLNMSMIYDLASSTNLAGIVKDIEIFTTEKTLLGEPNKPHKYRSAIIDSDSIFGLKREDIKERILTSVKEQYELKEAIKEIRYQKSKKKIINDLEIVIFNTINQNKEFQSLLVVGSTVKEGEEKQKTKTFTGYQIIGHIIPPSVSKTKNFQEYDIAFVYDLIHAPQKFEKIEILTTSKTIDISYKPIFS